MVTCPYCNKMFELRFPLNPLPLQIAAMPLRVVKVEYLPRPKGLPVQDTESRIPVVYVVENREMRYGNEN